MHLSKRAPHRNLQLRCASTNFAHVPNVLRAHICLRPHKCTSAHLCAAHPIIHVSYLLHAHSYTQFVHHSHADFADRPRLLASEAESHLCLRKCECKVKFCPNRIHRKTNAIVRFVIAMETTKTKLRANFFAFFTCLPVARSLARYVANAKSAGRRRRRSGEDVD